MPEVLALRLSGPLQSWGGHSRHTTRGTLTHPTKSGVVGLCAAALGRPRGADLSDLAALELGVRIDRPGTLLVDFHTISAASHGPLAPKEQRLPTSGGGRLKLGEGKVSRRSYLQDAVFVAALAAEGKRQVTLLDEVEAALRRPRYPLYLGRRSCPPDRRVLLGRHQGSDPVTVLGEVPWQGAPWRRSFEQERSEDSVQPPAQLPVVVDDRGGQELLPDLPLPGTAFARAFGNRPVRHTSVQGPGPAAGAEEGPQGPDGAGFGFSGDGSMAMCQEEGE